MSYWTIQWCLWFKPVTIPPNRCGHCLLPHPPPRACSPICVLTVPQHASLTHTHTPPCTPLPHTLYYIAYLCHTHLCVNNSLSLIHAVGLTEMEVRYGVARTGNIASPTFAPRFPHQPP